MSDSDEEGAYCFYGTEINRDQSHALRKAKDDASTRALPVWQQVSRFIYLDSYHLGKKENYSQNQSTNHSLSSTRCRKLPMLKAEEDSTEPLLEASAQATSTPLAPNKDGPRPPFDHLALTDHHQLHLSPSNNSWIKTSSTSFNAPIYKRPALTTPLAQLQQMQHDASSLPLNTQLTETKTLLPVVVLVLMIPPCYCSLMSSSCQSCMAPVSDCFKEWDGDMAKVLEVFLEMTCITRATKTYLNL